MNKELKNCPFCGGEAVIKENTRWDAHVSYKTKCVKCMKCGAKTQEKTSNGYYGEYCTDEEISKLWNTRKPINEIVQGLEVLGNEYPYKIIGIPETYTQYHEGWNDCLDRALWLVKECDGPDE